MRVEARATLDGTDSVTIADLAGTGLTDVSVDLANSPGSDFSDGADDVSVAAAVNGLIQVTVK